MFTSRPRDRRSDKPKKSKKDKKLSNLINNSDSDTGNESEHELSYYMEDRVKLMKEVLKIIKPKKIKIMAPDCMKRMQVDEINSMLLEESLGISNKRLKYIFEGKNLDDENSSTDEDQPVDVISLDDISEDDFVLISDDETDKHSKKHKRKRVKEEPKEKSTKVKKEKSDKEKGKEKSKEKGKDREKTTSKDKEPMGEENLMSVLELLELQARARAIRSQLDLETKRKKEEQEILERKQAEEAQEIDDDEEIIMEIPKEVEIIIASSDSENEEVKKADRNKASTSKESITISNANSTSAKNDTDNANDSSIQINDNFAGRNNNKTNNEKSENKDKNGKQKTSESINNTRRRDSTDKEEGEVSDGEAVEKEKSGEMMEFSVPPENGTKSDETMAKNRPNKETSSDTSNSGSDSSDNLQVVMLREKRKRKRARITTAENVKSPDMSLETAETGSSHSQDSAKNTNGNESMDQVINKIQSEESTDDATVTEENRDNQPQNDSTDTNVAIQSQGKLDNVIADFLKTQPPPPPDKTEEFNALEEAKRNEEKANLRKEKRLKHLKNKLQSYKKDVEGESSVTILENIVIKPKDVNPDTTKNKVTEDSDDLVINVDQADLDCIICD